MDSRKKFYLVSGVGAVIVLAFYLWKSRHQTIVQDNSDASNYPTNNAPSMSASGIPLNTGSNVYNINSGGDNIDLGSGSSFGNSSCCCGCGGYSGDGSPLVGSQQNLLASIPAPLLNNYIDSVPDNNVYIEPVKEVSKNTPMQTVNPLRIGFQAVF